MHFSFRYRRIVHAEENALERSPRGLRGRKEDAGGIAMSLTLNIVEHELQPYGHVHRSCADNPSFLNLRFYVGSSEVAIHEGSLYLVSRRESASTLARQGISCLYVNAVDDEPCEDAVISVTGGKSPLVVLDGLLNSFYRFATWERELDHLVVTQAPSQEMFDISTEFLENNVILVDPALKLLAYTRDNLCDDPVFIELVKHGYHTEKNIRKFKLHKRFGVWAKQEGFIINDEICKYRNVVLSFKTTHSFSLILVMTCNISEPEPYLLDTFAMFGKRIGEIARREYPDDKPSGNATDTFIHDLISGNIMSEEAVRNRCKYVDIPFEAYFCMFYIETPPESAPAARLLADVSSAVVPARAAIVRSGIVILCFNCESPRCSLHCSEGTCPMGKASISWKLENLMERYGLFCGRGSKFTQLTDAEVAYRQARAACAFGKRAYEKSVTTPLIHDWERVVSFDKFAIDYLVEECRGGDGLVRATFAGRVIEAMVKRDEETGTDDFKFLFEYLIGERRPSLVAERMHMHRNNVKYRIDHIEERYGIDTNDPTLRLALLLSCFLHEAAAARGEDS